MSASASSSCGDRVVQVRGRQERAGLLGQRIGDGGVGVAEHVDGDAGHQVEVAVAGVVPHPAALAADDDERLARVDRDMDASARARCAGWGFDGGSSWRVVASAASYIRYITAGSSRALVVYTVYNGAHDDTSSPARSASNWARMRRRASRSRQAMKIVSSPASVPTTPSSGSRSTARAMAFAAPGEVRRTSSGGRLVDGERQVEQQASQPIGRPGIAGRWAGRRRRGRPASRCARRARRPARRSRARRWPG